MSGSSHEFNVREFYEKIVDKTIAAMEEGENEDTRQVLQNIKQVRSLALLFVSECFFADMATKTRRGASI